MSLGEFIFLTEYLVNLSWREKDEALFSIIGSFNVRFRQYDCEHLGSACGQQSGLVQFGQLVV